jgi:hypothetical protein
MSPRREEAQRLRSKGWMYKDIAARMGVSTQASHQLVNRPMAYTSGVWVRLPRKTHDRLWRQYARASQRGGEAATDSGFRAWLSKRAAQALDA